MIADIENSKTRDSALHRFKRYEIKYLMNASQLPRLRERVRKHMKVAADPAPGASLVTSLYYDTRDLRFYREKIEGLPVRRKLRIRAYGEPETISDESQVFVEIKQRVNRVTQKRRIPLTYADARRLCDERVDPADTRVRPAFVNEVLTLVRTLDLHPAAITLYHREALAGVDQDLGLRITVDHRVRGRNSDFGFSTRATDQFIVPPHLSIIELKANELVPQWFTDLADELHLTPVRFSKYCRTIEAHHQGTRTEPEVALSRPVGVATPRSDDGARQPTP